MVVRSRPSHKPDCSFSSFGSITSDIYSGVGLDDDSILEDYQIGVDGEQALSMPPFATLDDGEEESIPVQPLRQRLGAASSIMAVTSSEIDDLNAPLTPLTPPQTPSLAEERDFDRRQSLPCVWSPSPLLPNPYDSISPHSSASSAASFCSATSLAPTSMSSLIASLDLICAIDTMDRAGAGEKHFLPTSELSRTRSPRSGSSSSLNPIDLYPRPSMDSITEESVDRNGGHQELKRPTLKARISSRPPNMAHQRKQAAKMSHRQTFNQRGDGAQGNDAGKNTAARSSGQNMQIFVDRNNEAKQGSQTSRTKRFGEHRDKENIYPGNKITLHSKKPDKNLRPGTGPDQGKLNRLTKSGKGKKDTVTASKATSTIEVYKTNENEHTQKSKKLFRPQVGKLGKQRTNNKLAPFRERNINAL